MNHPDAIPLHLLAEILGGGHSSRLYRDLVAQTQTAVQAQAITWFLEQDGLFAAVAVLPPFGSDSEKALNMIEKQINRLKTEPVTDLELTKAKNQIDY